MKSATLVDSIAKALPSRFTRRGFFTRSAVVGSALAASPLTYAPKPTSAYAAVCNCRGSNCTCGSLCCDGYTEFCCTLNGQNKCPAGTTLAGWWKADGTAFCGGPRYYMDCNAPCGGCGCGGSGLCPGGCSGTGCGCAGGDCNNRGTGCTLFRYGQCHNEIPCLGPIVCRVVTCVPPWAIEPTCSTVTRVDQGTAGHNRDCLHAVVGTLDSATEVAAGIRVTGWAIDFDVQDPVLVQAFIEGQLVGQAYANLNRPDVAPIYPGYGPNHGYDFTVVAPNRAATVCVVAYNPGANQLLGCATPTPHKPYGNIDSVAVGPTTVRVSGWAFDPDAPAAAIDVAIGVDGVDRVHVTANQYRPDLAGAFPGAGPNHGFTATVDVGSGSHSVCAIAINIGQGSNRVLGCQNFEIGSPFGAVDAVVPGFPGIDIQGWAIDPDTTGPINISVRVDGAAVTTAAANQSRPDVGAVYPSFGNDVGFLMNVPASPGAHTVCIDAINVGGGTNQTIGCKTVNIVSGQPFGSVDAVTAIPGGVRVLGWVIDPDTRNPTPIHVYIDGQYTTQTVANTNRPDVARVWGGYGNTHGFDLFVPVPGGVHSVCVFGIDSSGGQPNTLMHCRNVAVPTGRPFGSLDAVIPQSGGMRVTGWMIDPDTPNPVDVHIWVDGGPALAATANISRPDVANAFAGYGANHGFDVFVPRASGRHDVCLFGINVGVPDQNQLVACRQGVIVP